MCEMDAGGQKGEEVVPFWEHFADVISAKMMPLRWFRVCCIRPTRQSDAIPASSIESRHSHEVCQRPRDIRDIPYHSDVEFLKLAVNHRAAFAAIFSRSKVGHIRLLGTVLIYCFLTIIHDDFIRIYYLSTITNKFQDITARNLYSFFTSSE